MVMVFDDTSDFSESEDNDAPPVPLTYGKVTTYLNAMAPGLAAAQLPNGLGTFSSHLVCWATKEFQRVAHVNLHHDLINDKRFNGDQFCPLKHIVSYKKNILAAILLTAAMGTCQGFDTIEAVLTSLTHQVQTDFLVYSLQWFVKRCNNVNYNCIFNKSDLKKASLEAWKKNHWGRTKKNGIWTNQYCLDSLDNYSPACMAVRGVQLDFFLAADRLFQDACKGLNTRYINCTKTEVNKAIMKRNQAERHFVPYNGATIYELNALGNHTGTYGAAYV